MKTKVKLKDERVKEIYSKLKNLYDVLNENSNSDAVQTPVSYVAKELFIPTEIQSTLKREHYVVNKTKTPFYPEWRWIKPEPTILETRHIMRLSRIHKRKLNEQLKKKRNALVQKQINEKKSLAGKNRDFLKEDYFRNAVLSTISKMYKGIGMGYSDLTKELAYKAGINVSTFRTNHFYVLLEEGIFKKMGNLYFTNENANLFQNVFGSEVEVVIDSNEAITLEGEETLVKDLPAFERKKPPLGLIPKHIHEDQRYREVIRAIREYFQSAKKIPIEWVEEYNELTEKRFKSS